LRHLIERLEARTAEATELRIRLELTEKAQSTLEDELADERRRREETELERDELLRQLEAREEEPESPESPGPSETPTEAPVGQVSASERPEERSWWRRMFRG
jgi:septal ring factor EnvC (AmiA/AmiB activator)